MSKKITDALDAIAQRDAEGKLSEGDREALAVGGIYESREAEGLLTRAYELGFYGAREDALSLQPMRGAHEFGEAWLAPDKWADPLDRAALETAMHRAFYEGQHASLKDAMEAYGANVALLEELGVERALKEAALAEIDEGDAPTLERIHAAGEAERKEQDEITERERVLRPTPQAVGSRDPWIYVAILLRALDNGAMVGSEEGDASADMEADLAVKGLRHLAQGRPISAAVMHADPDKFAHPAVPKGGVYLNGACRQLIEALADGAAIGDYATAGNVNCSNANEAVALIAAEIGMPDPLHEEAG